MIFQGYGHTFKRNNSAIIIFPPLSTVVNFQNYFFFPLTAHHVLSEHKLVLEAIVVAKRMFIICNGMFHTLCGEVSWYVPYAITQLRIKILST